MSTGAVLDLKEGRYVACIWFYAARRWDFNGALWRDDNGDGRWHLTYRFRYDRPGGEDERFAYEGISDPDLPEEIAVRGGDELAAYVASQGANVIQDRLVLQTSDPIKIFETLRDRPWAHVSAAPGMAQA